MMVDHLPYLLMIELALFAIQLVAKELIISAVYADLISEKARQMCVMIFFISAVVLPTVGLVSYATYWFMQAHDHIYCAYAAFHGLYESCAM